MKVAPKDQAVINEFMREYVDRSYKTPMNAVRLNVDHTDAHRRTIFEVCNALLQEKIPFFTEVRLKCGTIPDIVCPTHVVRSSKCFLLKPKMFKSHRQVSEASSFVHTGSQQIDHLFSLMLRRVL